MAIIFLGNGLTIAQVLSSPTFEISSGASVNTRGGIPSSIDLQFLYYKDKYHKLGGRIEFQNVKHRKEAKYSLGNAKNYIYGKSNYLFSIRPQFVYSANLFSKEKENGVELNYQFLAGPSIGLVKPYYLQYYDENYDLIYTEPFSTSNTDQLVDSPGILYNLKSADKILGLNATFILDFELSDSSPIFWGVKIGTTFEYYPSGVFIMPTSSPNKFFPFLFINIYGGIRK